MTGMLVRNIILKSNFQVVMSKFLARSPPQCVSQTKTFCGFSQQLQCTPSAQYTSNKINSHNQKEVVSSNQVVNIHKIFIVSCRYYSDKDKSSTIAINLNATDDGSGQNNSSDKSENSEPKKGSKFKKYAIITLCVVYGGMFLSILYNLGLPIVDEEGRELKDEFSDLPPLEQFFKRMFDRLYVFKEFLRRPSRDLLLPEPNPLGHPKYTLVLEVTHVLLYPDWTYQTGWRFKKRPNLDHFLEQLASPMYEIVVFTSQAGMNMSPIVDSLNKGAGGSYINYSLYRDATEFINGEHVKNISHLNRDLSKVIVIDWNPNAIHLHPENGLILPKWSGNDDDSTLVELVAFLKSVAERSPEDVREILSYYKQFPDPMEKFRESQRKLPEPPSPS